METLLPPPTHPPPPQPHRYHIISDSRVQISINVRLSWDHYGQFCHFGHLSHLLLHPDLLLCDEKYETIFCKAIMNCFSLLERTVNEDMRDHAEGVAGRTDLGCEWVRMEGREGGGQLKRWHKWLIPTCRRRSPSICTYIMLAAWLSPGCTKYALFIIRFFQMIPSFTIHKVGTGC